MAQHLNDELEYIAEDYFDMSDFDDDEFGESQHQRGASEGSDFEGEVDMDKQKTDTSAYDFRNGKDMQGIPWEKLNYSRDEYREMRLKQYKNYENLSRSRESLEKECKKVDTGITYYDFQFNTRAVKSTIVHFQVLIYSLIFLFFKNSLPLHIEDISSHNMGCC